MKYLIRVIALPFFAGLVLIATIRLYFGYLINFIRFGGESIVYTQTRSQATIQDVFDAISKGIPVEIDRNISDEKIDGDFRALLSRLIEQGDINVSVERVAERRECHCDVCSCGGEHKQVSDGSNN